VDDARTAAGKATSRGIADELRAEIDTGAYAAGERLPSYRALMARFGVALNTAQAAVQLLEKDGYVLTRDRRGAYVVEREERKPAEVELHELRRELGDLRQDIRSTRDAVTALEHRVTAIVDRLGGLR
jgi:DNA-binding GntR family transcriptional regulator